MPDSPQENSLFKYSGPLTIQFINESCKDIEKELGTNTLTGKKLYSIFVELAQNIFYYSSETCHIGNETHGIGDIELLEDGVSYRLKAGNVVETKSLQILEKKCRLINNLDRSELRKLKFEQRNSTEKNPDSKGAGVGLIQIALTADDSLKVGFEPLGNRKTYFSLSVGVKKI